MCGPLVALQQCKLSLKAGARLAKLYFVFVCLAAPALYLSYGGSLKGFREEQNEISKRSTR